MAGLGLGEWDWRGVLPAYRRLERDLDFGDRDYHGDAGPITIRRYLREEMTLQQRVPRCRSRAWLSRLPGRQRSGRLGRRPQPMNKLGRLRVSCAIGYIAPARARANLTIRGETQVVRALCENGRCTGVEVTGRDGHPELDRR